MSAGEASPPRPAIDAESAPYWQAAREHRFLIQRCGACARYAFPPRALCPHCHRDALEWAEPSGGGTVYSFTVVRRAPGPAFEGIVPYVVALVDLDEGPRLLATLRVADPANAHVGQPVRVLFEDREDVTLPVFAPEV